MALVLAGAAMLPLLVRAESKVKCPVLDINLFKNNRVYLFSNLAALISYSATFAITFLLSLYLQYIKGLAPDQAGLVMLLQPAVMTVVSPYTGRLSDRMEPRLVASAGMALTFLSVLAFVFLDNETSILAIGLNLMLLGLGLALFTSPNTNAIMSSVEPRHYGIGSATLGTMRLVGQVGSMSFAMMVFSFYLGAVEISPPYYPQFLAAVRVAFAVSSLYACWASLLPWPGESCGANWAINPSDKAARANRRKSCPHLFNCSLLPSVIQSNTFGRISEIDKIWKRIVIILVSSPPLCALGRKSCS